MTRRITLCALVLIAAIPTFAQRRRAVNPGAGRCQMGTIVGDAYVAQMELDGQHVYWIDDLGGAILRAPIATGETELVGFLFEEGFATSMASDDTTLYIGIMPFDSFFMPTPGSIVTIPKSGGVTQTLVSGVNTPWDLEVDATHLYWAALGTLDFSNELLANDGKIERVTKDGATRQTLAENLSGPLDVALDANSVFFNEAGIANDDPTIAMYRVAKSGGTITTLASEVFALGFDVTDDWLIVWGATSEESGGLLRLPKNPGAPSLLVQDFSISARPHVVDGRAYYMSSDEEGSLSRLQWIDILDPQQPVTLVEGSLVIDDFEVDACSVWFGNYDPEAIQRTPR